MCVLAFLTAVCELATHLDLQRLCFRTARRPFEQRHRTKERGVEGAKKKQRLPPLVSNATVRIMRQDLPFFSGGLVT